MVARTSPHVCDVILAGSTQGLDNRCITNNLNSRGYKICCRTVERMRENQEKYGSIYRPWHFKPGPKKVVGSYLQKVYLF